MKKLYTLITIIILITILLFINKSTIKNKDPQFTNDIFKPESQVDKKASLISYENEFFKFQHFEGWVVTEHSQDDICEFSVSVNARCTLITDPTGEFTISIKVLFTKDEGGGLLNNGMVEDSKVIKFDASYLLRSEKLNYQNPEIGGPLITLYFIENENPKKGDSYQIWRNYDTYRIAISYKSNLRSEKVIDKSVLEMMDAILESVELL